MLRLKDEVDLRKEKPASRDGMEEEEGLYVEWLMRSTCGVM
jgi:hypothetical protein